MLRPDQAITEEPVPLAFFYRGNALPSYATVSLSRAVSSWKGPVVVLGDQESQLQVEGVQHEKFSDWYDDSEFDKFRQSSNLDGSFRSGFWLHATERFFVLEQWASKFNYERFAHAELDVDVRCSQAITAALDSWGKGVFYPFGTHEHAGASFFYSNSSKSLGLLVRHMTLEATSDEMHSLWNFGISHSEHVHVLPSHTVFNAPNRDLTELSFVPPEHVGGLFDVQPLGTWLLGQDPRNSPLEPFFNHFIFQEIGPTSLRNLRFFLDPFRNRLWARSLGTVWLEVLALHVHTKRFSLVNSRLVLFCIALAANLPFRVPLGWQNVFRFVTKRWKKPIDFFYSWLKKKI